MRIELTDVSKGRRGEALPATTLTFRSGEATLGVAETEQRPTVLGLIASGRMRADAGTVTLDGRVDAAAIRRRIALVDAPTVSDPSPEITVAGVVAEELMFAGRRSDPLSARRWLDGQGLRHLARLPIGDASPRDRIRMLLELAVLRPGVEGVVLVSPDRHGGDPQEWWTLARQLADRGPAVLVIAGHASQTALDTDTAPATRALPRAPRLRATTRTTLARTNMARKEASR